MRIATTQMYDNLLNGIRHQTELQAKGNAQVASGTRFQRPSEAGLDYKLSLDLRHAKASTAGSLGAINTASLRLEMSQTMLADMGNILVRAQTLAVQLGSDQYGAAERQAAAAEAGHLLDQFLADANQRLQGQALFSGTAINQDAFTLDAFGNYIYNGSNQDRIVAINDQQQVISNVRGDNPAFTSALSALQELQSALQANDGAGIRNALGNLISSGEQIVNLNAEVGARIRSLDTYRTSFEDMQFILDRRMNEHESVDVAAVVVQMQQASIALQASYSQIASLKSLSLVNFLR